MLKWGWLLISISLLWNLFSCSMCVCIHYFLSLLNYIDVAIILMIIHVFAHSWISMVIIFWLAEFILEGILWTHFNSSEMNRMKLAHEQHLFQFFSILHVTNTMPHTGALTNEIIYPSQSKLYGLLLLFQGKAIQRIEKWNLIT